MTITPIHSESLIPFIESEIRGFAPCIPVARDLLYAGTVPPAGRDSGDVDRIFDLTFFHFLTGACLAIRAIQSSGCLALNL